MMKRLTLGFAIALMTAPTLFAAPTLPWQAADRIPAWVLEALCTYLNIGCP